MCAALLSHSSVDMQSQEAYELAVSGELGPQGKSPPILTGLRVTAFQPPFFTLGEYLPLNHVFSINPLSAKNRFLFPCVVSKNDFFRF